jgi:uncharacterized membrane protein YdfJ with MMPL/SSD domain
MPGGRLSLRVVAGPGAGQTIEVGDAPVVLGRATPQAAQLAGDHQLSREHIRVEPTAEGLELSDLGSTNGTFVNGARVGEPTPLEAGDVIWIGNSTLLVSPSEAPPPDVAPVEPPTPSAQAGFLSRIAASAVHNPKRMLIGLGIFFVLSVVVGGPVAKQLRDERGFFDANAEASLGLKHIGDASGAQPGASAVVIVHSDRGIPKDPAIKREILALQKRIEADKDVAATVSFFSFGDQFFLSRDQRSTYIGIVFKNVDVEDREIAAERLEDEIAKPPRIELGGPLIAVRQLREQVEKDLRKAELIGLPLLLLVAFFVFRSFVSALMPIGVGVVTVFASFVALRIIDALATVNIFALNIITALGLGLAIDYSLFMVTRYREELAKVGAGRPDSGLYGAVPGVSTSGRTFPGSQDEALRRTVLTAGRTILFSSVTVAVALLSLVVFPQPFVRSMGIGGAVAASVAGLVAIVMLPALLAVLGPRVNGLAPGWMQRSARRSAAAERSGAWYRLTQGVMRFPLPVALGSAALMLVVALAFTRADFGGVNSRILPQHLEAKQVSDELATSFPVDPSSQIWIAVEAGGDASPRLTQYVRSLEKLDGVAAVYPPRRLNARFWEIDVQPWLDGLNDSTVSLAKTIRDRGAPFPIEVTGDSADFADERSALSSRLPIVIALLALTTFVILFVMTGSVVLPLKTILMNLLTVGFTLGLLVLVFQDGRLEKLLGFTSLGEVDMAQPVVICAVVFGLSTDYAVFLMGRIIEARSQGLGDSEAVSIGIQRTGPVVTQAALLFCLAIAAFMTSDVIYIKQVGLGAAAAVIIDSTIVRGLLVPALMTMLGRRNWWAPGPLRRLHNRVGLSEA